MCLKLNVLCAKHIIKYKFMSVYIWLISIGRTSDDNVSRKSLRRVHIIL